MFCSLTVIQEKTGSSDFPSYSLYLDGTNEESGFKLIHFKDVVLGMPQSRDGQMFCFGYTITSFLNSALQFDLLNRVIYCNARNNYKKHTCGMALLQSYTTFHIELKMGGS